MIDFASLSTPVIVAVLAGGKSRRMGRDKAAIKFGGITLLEKVCSAASAAGLPALVVGRKPEDISDVLNERYYVIPDDGPDCGPLGGLATALRHAPHHSILLCATDLPRILPESFQWLVAEGEKHAQRDYNGIVPMWQGRPEPLFAIYRHDTLPLTETLIGQARFAMRDLLAVGQFLFTDLPDLHTDAVADVDTPADLTVADMEG